MWCGRDVGVDVGCFEKKVVCYVSVNSTTWTLFVRFLFSIFFFKSIRFLYAADFDKKQMTLDRHPYFLEESGLYMSLNAFTTGNPFRGQTD